jgi:hypothetical protein
MQKRFLINADGTVPANAPIAALEAAGVILVVPTPVPVPPEGQIVVEADAVQVNGVWRQVWEFAPAPEPEEPPMPILTRPQFEFLLGVTGLADVWVAVEEAVKPSDPVQYGLLRGLRARDTFRYESTLAMVGDFAPFLPEGVTLDDETLRPLWLQAAAVDI